MFKDKKAKCFFIIITILVIAMVTSLFTKYYQLLILALTVLADMIFLRFWGEKIEDFKIYSIFEKYYEGKKDSIKHSLLFINFSIFVIINIIFMFSKLTVFSFVLYIAAQLILFFALHFITFPAFLNTTIHE